MLEIATAEHEAHFAYLQSDRDAIDQELGGTPQWTSTGARDYVITELPNADFRDRAGWPDQHARLIELLERYRKAFTQKITGLPAGTIGTEPAPVSE